MVFEVIVLIVVMVCYFELFIVVSELVLVFESICVILGCIGLVFIVLVMVVGFGMWCDGVVVLCIEFDDVVFGYDGGSGLVFDGVSFCLQLGIMMVIVGLFGCGKSMILVLIVGLYQFICGCVFIDGIDVVMLDVWVQQVVCSVVF